MAYDNDKSFGFSESPKPASKGKAAYAETGPCENRRPAKQERPESYRPNYAPNRTDRRKRECLLLEKS